MVVVLSPTQLIAHLLANAPAKLRRDVLLEAKAANQRILQHLNDEQLLSEEQGWADYWRSRHTRTTDTLAAIEQALATC